MSNVQRIADEVRRLTPQAKQQLAALLAGDHDFVEAIVPRSHFKPMIDLLLKTLRAASQAPVDVILREEIAHRKRQRDRKSDPAIIRRNLEICGLRKQDPKKWSLKALAKKYRKSFRTITLVLGEEDKWRELAQMRND